MGLFAGRIAGRMRKPVILITGAEGEIGHGLVARLAASGAPIVTLDVSSLDSTLSPLVVREFIGSITDTNLLDRMLAEFEVDCVFHLAALLSTRAEFTPVAAHEVNVGGTLNLLEFAQKQGESHVRSVVFIYPSSIAAHGLPDLETKTRAGRVREDEYTSPMTMYGCNKLYCEQLGRYYTRYYKQLSADVVRRVDFRSVRFPGLISAVTRPSGGTSDYASEMIHAAAKREPCSCFVRPDTTIPFMAMPDAVDALLTLASARRERLTRTAYNVRAFNPSAADIRGVVMNAFPDATITFAVDDKRQGIVDSWPADVNDESARHDWGFSPAYDFERAFREYLIPTIRQRYRDQRPDAPTTT
jgi:threonine 3-dehydrogenase